jgi:ComF family protein
MVLKGGVEVLPQLASFKRAALDLFFPQKCIGCGEEGAVICPQCRKYLAKIVPPICPICGKPQINGIICPVCLKWHHHIDGIRSPYRFEATIRETIHQLKYKNIRCLAEPLAVLLFNYLKRNPLDFDVIVPVPLHHKRLRERGYNQSDLLAQELSKLTYVPVVNDSLKRSKYLLPQAKTRSVEERRKNVELAFNCVNSKLVNSKVLLIDDVSTSGATLEACARALKATGAASVWAIVLAREL